MLHNKKFSICSYRFASVVFGRLTLVCTVYSVFIRVFKRTAKANLKKKAFVKVIVVESPGYMTLKFQKIPNYGPDSRPKTFK